MRLTRKQVIELPPGNALRKAFEAMLTPKGRSKWSASQTTCTRGHPHPSKVEAAVCESVFDEAERTAGARVYVWPRLPLWALAPGPDGRPLYATPDFAIVLGGRLCRIIDAKSGTRSRDWRRGKAALEATYFLKVEEWTRPGSRSGLGGRSPASPAGR